ncbi:MAG: amino acid adenylation domain-containing protein [Candidatus Aminicenantes bacterium]|nr:amino acid adenylation domain-containing protein [Candidatus Aminicenantes bacterium]NIM81791.1 amino acid adenylation domain-containing protein [Candidatus Aminicenantes bacterium]NIN21163.1 amino acid adenylation domain-containing protein [Candidatus Aminicenantes bacterium]NIN44987.1 amino acid adenylation domain-containing protein [Candidatus Aminicenantes bacterium]NIN87801.1 amino acid adenylation domain-containing protein [Candidatus Aminicenantes bacterium]
MNGNANDEPGFEVVVIGMAGRFPGAKNIDEFWENVKNGMECISFFSDEELEEPGVDVGRLKNPCFVKVKAGMDESEYFDSSFFGYTPKEAEIMDPQVRIFHECVWEALENAGYDPGLYKGLIGLYAGAAANLSWQGAAVLSEAGKDIGPLPAQQLMDKDYMCARIAYKLGLKGPAFIVNTFCSTSLVAVHLACQALLNGECDMALAGGVSITMPPVKGYLYEEGMIYSPDGHCRAFDAGAKGTVFGDGSGVVVLKRLDEALEEGDYIYAVIKGSSINNDGDKKVGFTAPGIEGQAGVIRMALQAAEIEPESITYVETHGTGTNLGDPAEIAALKLAFQTGKKGYCAVGSVKTNIGHLNTAAGAAGFIKTVLALKHKLIPPSLHFTNPNPGIDFKNSPFYVNTKLTEWKSDGYPLRAGVSSFGIGGTNAHVILEEWSEIAGRRGDSPWSPPTSREHQLILLSAKTESALDQMALNLAAYLKKSPHLNLADAAYTLQVGRKAFQHRKMLVCSTKEQAIGALTSAAAPVGRPSEKEPVILHAYSDSREDRPVYFMFSGLGSQYIDMGRELYEKEFLFRQEMDRCFDILNSLVGIDFKEILYPSEPNISLFCPLRDQHAQPLLFSFEYCLAKLLMKWGIKPLAMIGYSFGEYAAACTAGVFSLEDALELVVYRGRLIRETPGGAMLSVPVPQSELKPLLPADLSIAVDNGMSCIVSGAKESVQAFEKQLKEKKYLCNWLETSHAVHSRLMEPIVKKFEEKFLQVRLNKPQIPYISNVTGKFITAEEATNPLYWTKHLRETVRFAGGVKELVKEPGAIFIEIGPGQDLSALVVRYLEDSPEPDQHVINLVRHPRKKVSDQYYLLSKMGFLWLYGIKIDWAGFYSEEKRRRNPLPTYPFEKEQYWLDEIPSGSGYPIYNYHYNIHSQEKELTVAKKPDIADWFYLPQWERSQFMSFGSSGTAGQSCGLVFIDESNFCSQLVKRLCREGWELILVEKGAAFSVKDEQKYIIDPKQRDHYIALMDELQRTNKIPVNIVHLWSLSEVNSNDEELEKEKIDKAQDLGLYSVLYLVQAIDKKGFTEKFNIHIVSNTLHEVRGDEILAPEKATVLGLARTVHQEIVNIKCRCIDIILPVSRSPQEEILVDQLVGEFSFSLQSSERVIAYRGNYRWVETYKPVRLEEIDGAVPRLKEKGVYLITGGLGNVGFILAKYLAKTYRARLILTGRTILPPRLEWESYLAAQRKGGSSSISQKIGKVVELEKMGGEVLACGVDAADEKQMRSLVNQAEERFGPINGIVHAAGIVRGNTLQTLDRIKKEDFQQQFQAKIYGLTVLARLFQGRELDFCLLISSPSSILGGLGLAAYTAANIFMDVFVCRHNRNSCTPWSTVNWGDWESQEKTDEGVFIRGSVGELLMSPEEGVETFRRILKYYRVNRVNQVAVSAGDLQDRIDKWVKLEFLQREDRAQKRKRKPGILKPRPNLMSLYTPPGTPVEEILAEIWINLFGYEKIGIYDDFFELGGDSLKAITAVTLIHKKLATKVPLENFFTVPTIKRLAHYISTGKKSAYFSIGLAEEKEYYLLSSVQKRLYFLQKLEKDNTGYNETIVLLLEGELDIERLRQVVTKLIIRHEILRTSIEVIGEVPVQRILPGVIDDVDVVRYFETSEEEAEKLVKNFIKPFDLSNPPLFRIMVIKIAEGRYIFIRDMHHIVTDGVSDSIFTRDFMKLYANANEEEEPGKIIIQYKDYAEWQQRQTRHEEMKKQEQYWLEVFAGEIPVLNLPAVNARPPVQSFEGFVIPFTLNTYQAESLKKLATGRGVTLYMVLLAIYNIFLSKLCSQEDIVVGTPVAGRRHADIEQVLGMFINTLVLRNFVDESKIFTEFLTDIRRNTLNAFENQDYPFEEIVEHAALNVKRDVSRNPLFDVVFVMQNIDIAEIEIPGLKLKPYKYENTRSKFDLTLRVMEADEGLKLQFEYSTKLFKKETIKRFVNYFKRIASSVVKNPGIKLRQIEIITEKEKNQVLYDFNDTRWDYPKDKTIHQLFEEQAERTPDNIAVVGSQNKTGEVGQLTYKELDQRSGQLAHSLRKKGINADIIVGIAVKPSVNMLIGILGILKSGAAYLPIYPDYPEERINYMLKDSNAGLLLTANELSGIYGDTAYRASTRVLSSTSTLASSQTVPTAGLAYVIYTSGSTGWPRGVMIRHSSLINLCCWHNRCFFVTCQDIAAKYAGFGFDASVWEIFPYLIAGASLIMVPEDIKLDMEQLNRFMERHYITISFLPTQVCEQFMKLENRSLRVLLTGGDKLKHFIKRRYLLVNNYGPTENTVVTTHFDVDQFDHNIPIGQPAANTSIYILDSYGNLQPIGVPGELCIGGDGLARGYLNQPELTAEKFINFSHNTRHLTINTRLYRTGDLACWLPDGNIEFLGRKDFQIKIRGFRVELGEIESQLLKHSQVKETVVLAREDHEGEKYLCAYVVTEPINAPGGNLNVMELKTYLSATLPNYMIPSYFIPLDAIPLTSNGKVDRNALPILGMKQGDDYEAPRDEIEKKLVKIIAEVLKIEEEIIGIDSDFFELGGHSLKAVHLVTRIQVELGVKISLVEIFKNPTARRLRGYIKRSSGDIYIGIKAVEKQEYYDLSQAQKSLWSVDKVGKYQVAYNMSAAYIFEGELRQEVLERTFATIVKRHESLRTIFVMIGNEPGQKILDFEQMDFKVDYIDLRHLPDPEIRARETADQDEAIAFKLEKGPLLRVKLLQTGDYRHILLFTLHHIISDGWSQEVLIDEALTLYNAYSKGTEPPLPPLKIQYKDYAVWHNQLLKNERLKEDRDYWWSQFMGEIPVLDLPTDFKRPPVRTLKGNYVSFELDDSTCKGLLSLGQQNGATLFMTLLASVNLLLYCYSGQEDIILGTVISGRDNKDLTGQMGYFLNTLALRTRFSGSEGFATLLRQVKKTLLGAIKHQLYPFGLLMEDLNLKRDMSRSPLFDVMVHLQDMESAIEMEGMSVKSYEFGARNSKFDLMFNFYQEKNSIFSVLKYKTDLFKYDTIVRMANRFKRLVNNVLENPGKQVSDLTFENEREFKIPGISPISRKRLSPQVQEIR